MHVCVCVCVCRVIQTQDIRYAPIPFVDYLVHSFGNDCATGKRVVPLPVMLKRYIKNGKSKTMTRRLK